MFYNNSTLQSDRIYRLITFCILCLIRNMYNPVLLKNDSKSHTLPSRVGVKNEPSTISHYQTVTANCTTTTISLKKLEQTNQSRNKDRVFVMQEFLRHIKNKTYKDKLICSKNNSQIINYIKKLEVGLIEKEKNLKPFWNNLSREISKKLWLPTKTDCADCDQQF